MIMGGASPRLSTAWERAIEGEALDGPVCEDCGEPATSCTADGVWLCDGDMAEVTRMMPDSEAVT